MKHSFKIAFCGIMTALALVCMFIAPLIPVAMYTCTLLSGVCIAVAVEEAGLRQALGVYIAASILSLLLLPDKETAVVFITVFGFYPIYKNYTERLRNVFFRRTSVRTALKLLFINISCVMYFLITVYLLGIPKESFTIGDVYLPGVFLIIGNVGCLMYDRALDGLIAVYRYKFRKKIFRKW